MGNFVYLFTFVLDKIDFAENFCYNIFKGNENTPNKQGEIRADE